MVAWSGTPVLCTLFQQPLLSCPFCTNMYDFLPTFNNEAHLNLSEIYFFLTISNQVNQSIHKMCVVNFSEQRALVSNSYLPSPKPGESHPIFKATSNHSMPLHLGMHLCLRYGCCFWFSFTMLVYLGHVQPLRCIGDFQMVKRVYFMATAGTERFPD